MKQFNLMILCDTPEAAAEAQAAGVDGISMTSNISASPNVSTGVMPFSRTTTSKGLRN